MAQSKFTLYRYIKLANGSWRYCKAAFYSNGKIKPNRCIVGGKEEEHPAGAYYLNHNNKWIAVGTDALEAQRQRNARLDDDEFKRLRGTAAEQSPNIVPISKRRTLADAAEEWCNETEANRKRKTYLAYKKFSEYFIQSCPKGTVDVVDRKDMPNFKVFLKRNSLLGPLRGRRR